MSIKGPEKLLAAAVLCYLLLAVTFAHVKAPWIDEGWVTSAPANWAAIGGFGTPSLEPTGSWLGAELTGIRNYTYWNLPVGITLQALCFKLIGYSIVRMRVPGICAGLLAVLSWFVIVAKLAQDRWAGAITASLIAIDSTFLWSAADGRMDMICFALGAASLATFLLLRDRSLENALWCSSLIAALSLFTHPNGLFFVLALAVLVLWFDRTRLRPRHIWALGPFFAIAALWCLYIRLHPDLFLAQFTANAGAHGGVRWGGLRHPLMAILQEFFRYARHYGLEPLWGGAVADWTFTIPLVYIAAFVVALRRNHRAPLFALAVLCLLFMTYLVGLKAECYLPLIIPLYLALLAIWLRRKTVPAILAICLLCFAQGTTIAAKIRANTLHNDYLPVTQFVQSRLQPGKQVYADSYFGVTLGFPQVVDDCRLGYFTGKQPDLLIEDVWWTWWWAHLFPAEEPTTADYIRRLLAEHYHLIFQKGPLRVYERRS